MEGRWCRLGNLPALHDSESTGAVVFRRWRHNCLTEAQRDCCICLVIPHSDSYWLPITTKSRFHKHLISLTWNVLVRCLIISPSIHFYFWISIIRPQNTLKITMWKYQNGSASGGDVWLGCQQRSLGSPLKRADMENGGSSLCLMPPSKPGISPKLTSKEKRLLWFQFGALGPIDCCTVRVRAKRLAHSDYMWESQSPTALLKNMPLATRVPPIMSHFLWFPTPRNDTKLGVNNLPTQAMQKVSPPNHSNQDYL